MKTFSLTTGKAVISPNDAGRNVKMIPTLSMDNHVVIVSKKGVRGSGRLEGRILDQNSSEVSVHAFIISNLGYYMAFQKTLLGLRP